MGLKYSKVFDGYYILNMEYLLEILDFTRLENKDPYDKTKI